MEAGGKTPGKRWLPVWVLALGALLVFVGANAHLVYVSFSSDPGCVAHLKTPGAQPGER